ncbi:hypothetical protein [Thermocoleostomius sinensis]|uniref:Uncharacterized protein n=1 Tax=Thermocoleostomius sinensis A174 TaxID=2016057 RepID=A0A9E9CBM3_9CYAN|nr:hypothetical protein [Thermocoleostomius sinensis]WAL60800.1 hypothetical protein OXH18_02050 [Thermocoleostomius sinensis A174]
MNYKSIALGRFSDYPSFFTFSVFFWEIPKRLLRNLKNSIDRLRNRVQYTDTLLGGLSVVCP